MKINPDDVRRKVLEALRKQVSSAWLPDSRRNVRGRIASRVALRA